MQLHLLRAGNRLGLARSDFTRVQGLLVYILKLLNVEYLYRLVQYYLLFVKALYLRSCLPVVNLPLCNDQEFHFSHANTLNLINHAVCLEGIIATSCSFLQYNITIRQLLIDGDFAIVEDRVHVHFIYQ